VLESSNQGLHSFIKVIQDISKLALKETLEVRLDPENSYQLF
jgi:hypothetical protein